MKQKIRIGIRRYIALILVVTMLPFQQVGASASQTDMSATGYGMSGNSASGTTSDVIEEQYVLEQDWTLEQDETVYEMRIEAGNLNLNGYTLTVLGDVAQIGGTVTINGGALYVGGDYTIQGDGQTDADSEASASDGVLCMKNQEDYVSVSGNFVTNSSVSHVGKLTAGTLALYGDFTQLATESDYSFASTGEHRVVLCGQESQTVKFASSTTGNSRIANLVLNEKAEERYVFEGIPVVTESIDDQAIYTEKEGYIGIGSGTTFANGIYAGDVCAVQTCSISQALVITGDFMSENVTVTILGDMTVSGNMLVGGVLKLDYATVDVGGNADFQQSSKVGLLRMDQKREKFTVSGNFTYAGKTSDVSYLTGGTIEVCGDFTAESGFVASGDNTVLLSGSKEQTLDMAEGQKFAILELQNSSTEGVCAEKIFLKDKIILNDTKLTYRNEEGRIGWTLTEDMTVEENLTLLEGTLDLNGYTLTICGDFLHKSGIVDVNGGKLLVEGNYKLEGESESASVGILQMQKEQDYVMVQEDFVVRTNACHEGFLTDGTLEVKGDFLTYTTKEVKNFCATEMHTVILSGEEKQTVTLNNGAINKTAFQNLTLKNSGSQGVEFSVIAPVKGVVVTEKNTLITGVLGIGSDVIFDSGEEEEAYYQGDVETLQDYVVTAPLTVSGDFSSKYYSVTVREKFTVSGNLIAAKKLRLEAATVEVKNDLVMSIGTTAKNYGLQMQNEEDVLIVGGNITYNQDSNQGYLTDGRIEIKGDVSITRGFYASGDNRLVLIGDSEQTLDINESLNLATLEIANKSAQGVVSKGPLNVEELITNGCRFRYEGIDGVSGFCLQSDLTVPGDMVLLDGVMDLNGYTLTVAGDLTQIGGTLDLNGGKLQVQGDYYMQYRKISDDTDEVEVSTGAGSICMDQEQDCVDVEGDYIVQSAISMEEWFLAGTISVGGDVRQIGKCAIQTDQSHTFILDGEQAQTMQLQKNATFSNIVFDNSSQSGITLDGNLSVTEKLTDSSLRVSGEGTVRVADMDILTDGYFGGNLTLNKADVLSGDIKIGGEIVLSEKLDINGRILYATDMQVEDTCILGGGRIMLSEDMTVTKSGKLIMNDPDDQVLVVGALVYQSEYPQAGYLTAGVMEVQGDFLQHEDAYINATQNHTFVLGRKKDENGRVYVQNIEFGDASKVRFHTLVLEKMRETGYVFNADIYQLADEVIEAATDEIPPSAITEISAVQIGCASVTVSYNGAQDENGIAGYYIYRDGVKVGITEQLHFTDEGLKPGQTYSYQVCAYDYFQNIGAMSEMLTVTTGQDDEAPDKVTGLSVEKVTGSAVCLKWDTATDNGMIKGYDIYRDGELLADGVTETSFKDDTITPMTIYRYFVCAVDCGNNRSQPCESIDAAGFMPEIVEVSPKDYSTVGGDTVKLSVRFKDFGNSTGNKVTITWAAPDGEETHDITLVPLQQRRINSQTLGADYTWDISGFEEDRELKICFCVTDEDGNKTENSVTYYVDKTGPSAPTNVEVTDEGGNLRIIWDASTSDDCGGYMVYRLDERSRWKQIGQVYGGNKLSYLDQDVAEGEEYTYCVRAYDIFDQAGEESEAVSGAAGEDTAAPYIVSISPEDPLISGITQFVVEAEDNCKIDRLRLYLQKGEEEKIPVVNQSVEKQSAKVTLSVDTTKYEDGGYTLYLVAEDDNGNLSEEFKRYYNIDNEGIEKVELGDCFVTSTALQLNWKNVGADDFAYFSVEEKCQDEFKEIAQIDDALSYIKKDLEPETAYTFRVVAYDKASNRGTESEEITLITEKDDIAPQIIAVSPVEASYGKKIELKITAKDNSELQKAVFSWSQNKMDYTTIAEIEAEAGEKQRVFSYLWNTADLPEGEIFVKFQVTDRAGNLNALSEDAEVVATYRIDHTPPSGVKGFGAVGEEGQITLAWENNDEAAYYKVYRATEGGLFYLHKNECVNNCYTDVDVVTDTEYSYYLTAVDEAGNEGEASLIAEAMCQPDREAPEIKGISVSDNAIISKNTRVSVLALDNSSMGTIRLEYRKKGSQGSYNRMETGEVENRICYGEFSLEDETLEENVIYEFRFSALDQAGNVSAYVKREIQFDLTAPAKPELTADSESFYVALRWTANTESDFSYYEVYRRKYNTQEEELIFTTKTTEYEDRTVEPDSLYYYRVEAVDILENRSVSDTKYSYANTLDSEKPEAVLQEKYDVMCDAAVTFDGTLSHDNVGVVSYVWEFGDGTFGSGAQVKHTYHKSGTYTIKLTVYDARGNFDEATRCVRVLGSESGCGGMEFHVKNQEGVMLAGAYLSVKNTETGEVSDLRTNNYGVADFSGKSGKYQVSTYAVGYLPSEIYVTITGRERSKENITLTEGSVVTGEIECRRLDLDEIIENGISLSDPDNCHQYEFKLEICFARQSIPVQMSWIAIPMKANHNSGSKGKGYSHSGDGGRDPDKSNIDVIDTGKEMIPIVQIFELHGEISWLKEMYAADLYIVNGAKGNYSVENSVAKLNVPSGMTLLSTKAGQNEQQNIGSLQAGENKTISWILRGDEKGYYDLSAEFSGVLEPFGTPLYSLMESHALVEVSAGDGLHIYLRPETAHYLNMNYYVYCSLVNESNRSFYNVDFTVGGMTYQAGGTAYQVNDPQYALGSEEEQPEEEPEEETSSSGMSKIDVLTADTVGNYRCSIVEEENPNEYEANEQVAKPDERNVWKIRSKKYDTVSYNGTDSSGGSQSSFVGGDSDTTQNFPILISDEGSIHTDALYPGQSMEFLYKIQMGYSGDPEKEYYRMTHYFVEVLEGENLGVKVSVNTIGSHVPSYLRFKQSMNQAVQQEMYYGDPVDISSGAFVQEINALSVKGADTLSLDLTYNSILSDRDGETGYGFTHTYEQYIVDRGAWLILRDGSGSEHKFVKKDELSNISRYEPVAQEMKGRCIEEKTDGYLLIGEDGSEMTFDSYGYLTGITGTEGRHITVSWDKNTQIIKEDISGEVLYLRYNKSGRIGKAWDLHGRMVLFAYDQYGNLCRYTDVLGNVTNYEYNNLHMMTKVTNAAEDVVVKNGYDTYGRVITQEEPERGRPAIFTYSDGDYGYNIIKVSDHTGAETVVTCDEQGNVRSETDGNGRTQSYTYVNHNDLATVRDANGNLTSYSYDENGYMTGMTDPNGNTITYSYDSKGNVKEIISPDGDKSTYTYDEKGLLLTYTNPLGGIQKSTYDNNGLLLTQSQEGLGTTQYVYNKGRLQKVIDAKGGVSEFTYDEYGNMSSSTDALGNKTEWVYDMAGNLLEEEYPDGRTVVYTYDCLNQVTKQVETSVTGGIREKTFSYDKAGRLTEETDALGRVTKYTYDGEDRLTKVVHPDGTEDTYTYDAVGNMLSHTAANGLYTKYTSDGAGNVTKLEVGEKTYCYELLWNGKIETETLPDGSRISYDYDSSYNCIRRTDALGNSYLSSYDAMGNLLKETDPIGASTEYTYDTVGRTTKVTDANGNVTLYTYDTAGNVTCTTDALGYTTRMEYDLCNRMTVLKKTVSANEIKEQYTYDECGNIKSITDAKGEETCFVYNSYGQLLAKIDANGKKESTNTYDAAGRMVSTTSAVGTTTGYTYDISDRITCLTQAQGTEEEVSASYGYDSVGNHTSTTDAEQGKAGATYDLYGNLLTQTDAMDNLMIYEYDLMDRCVKETNALGKSQTYEYDKNGNLIAFTDYSGVKATYTYDRVGRLIREQKGLFDTAYTYDSVGNLLTVTDSTGTIRRVYDKLNRVTEVTDCNGKTIKYGYDELGNRISVTYPGGRVVRYTWDECQNLESMTDPEGNTTYYRYDPVGRLIETVRPDQSTETRDYDAAGRIRTIEDVAEDGEKIQMLSYTYDSRGNITEIKSETEADLPQAETGDMSCTYGKDNRLLTFNGEAVVYDNNGNMTCGPVNGQRAELIYDAYDRLIKVKTADGAETVYTYDAENVRIGAAHTAADGTTWEETYVTDRETSHSQLLTAERNGEETLYTYGLGLASAIEGGNISYYHYDHLGSTTALTDSDGNITARAAYGTYGELLGVTDELRTGTAAAGEGALRFLYNGQYGIQTDVNELYYMRARYYSQDMRRFVNLDVLKGDLTNTQSLNRYIYVQGNPVIAIDPLGLCPMYSLPKIDKHSLLGALSCLPYVGVGFAVYDAYLYYKEKNYSMMASALAGAVAGACGIVGTGVVKLAKSGAMLTKTAERVKSVMAFTALGTGVAAAGYQFGTALSDAITEKRETGQISTATMDNLLYTGGMSLLTTAIGVGAMKRAAPSKVTKEALEAGASSSGGEAARDGSMLFGDEWDSYFRSQYGDDSVDWVSKGGSKSGANASTYYHSCGDDVADVIATSGFRTDIPDEISAFHNNRYGRGVYLADTPTTALSERPGGTILKVTANSGKNLNLTSRGVIGGNDYSMTHAIARGARKHGYDSITFMSAKNQNGINTVIFNPVNINIVEVMR